MTPANQNLSDRLGQALFRAKRIRAALLEVASVLHRRPDPRSCWDDLARADSAERTPWLDKDVDLCRSALAAAAAEGPGQLAAALQRVERYFAEKHTLAIDGFEAAGQPTLGSSILHMTRETADVMVAAAEVSHSTSESHLEALRTQAMEAEAAIDEVIALSSAQLARRSHVRLHR